MKSTVDKEVAVLSRMSTGELRQRYAEVFGEATRANNKPWLIRRIAWRLQALAEGDLGERARCRAKELARDEDLRVVPPRPAKASADQEVVVLPMKSDARLPRPGTVITRPYKGTTVRVTVLPKGFLYDGEEFKTLSAVAKRVTGSHCNGYLFFKLTGGGE